MRAIVVHKLGDRDTVSLEQIAAPEPAADEVVIDAAAVSVNYVDLLAIDGKYQNVPPIPFTPGKEVAGVVASVGTDVSTLEAGNHVLAHVAHGAFAEKVRAKAALCYRMPEGMQFDTAAAMGLAHITAYFGLVVRGELRSGDTVLVTGASGGVGLAAVELGKALGARVLAGLTTLEKSSAVRAAGADQTIDLSADSLRDALREQINAATAGAGVQLALDVLGGDVFDACLRAIAPCGRIVVAGFMAGRIPEVKTNYLLLKNISVVGLSTNYYLHEAPEKFEQAQAELFRLYQAGKIKPKIMASYSLENFADALDVLEGRKVVGKVVMTVD